MTIASLPADILIKNGSAFFISVIAILIATNGIITFAILRYRLLDIEITKRRTINFVFIWLSLFLAILPFLSWIYRFILNDPANSFWLFTVGFLSLGTVLFLGPFLYAYFIQRRSYFNDYTIAGLAHELKNPLGIIEHAVVYLTDHEFIYPFGSKQSEYMRMIERNAYLMRRTIENLFHVFKFKGENVLQLELMDIRAVCHHVAESFRSIAAIKGVDLEEDAPSEEIMVLCDSEKIDQALSNLVSNAVKFTKQGKIRIKIEDKKDHALVSVEDSGPGISKDELPYVFDRFYQGGSGRRVAKGTGLGLAIAKTWITAHQGKIYAHSDGLGKGSRLWVSLPK